MPESTPFEPEITELQPQTVAMVREQAALGDMTDFFSRAFGQVMGAIGAAGAAVAGPPIGVYYAMEQGSADVGAGFPVSVDVSADGVQSAPLPGGRAVQVMHHGPYDTLEHTYGRLMDWLTEQELNPSPLMWESYLNEPDPDAPEATQTLITWPLDE